MKQPKIADLETCQEFRIGKTWYMALLPALCRASRYLSNRWCFNLKTMKAEAIKGRARAAELR